MDNMAWGKRSVIRVGLIGALLWTGCPCAAPADAGCRERSVRRSVHRGQSLDRRQFLLGLSDMQYTRHELALERGNYRVRGDVIEVQTPLPKRNNARIEVLCKFTSLRTTSLSRLAVSVARSNDAAF